MPSSNGRTPPKHFHLPVNTSGRGNALKIGRGVSVYYDFQPANHWPEHQHPTAQILVALEAVDSTMTWRAGTRASTLTSSIPHVWIIPPRTPHSVTWKGAAAMLVIYVERSYIRDECGQDLTEAGLFSLGPLARQDYLVTRLCAKFRDLCHGRRKFSDLLVVAGGTLLVALLLRAFLGRSNQGSERPRGLAEKRLENVARFIEHHLRESISRATLAKVAGLTECHFSRMFRVSTGIPPMKYVWRCRIHHARQLLESGGWKVAAAAAETGFCDQSHLDRQFRREFGCSPGSVIPDQTIP